MKNHIDDRHLNRLLDTVRPMPTQDHIRAVRTSLLVKVHATDQFSWAAIFGFRPALMVATALLGFVLGASLPNGNLSDYMTNTVLEDQPQSFLTGGDWG